MNNRPLIILASVVLAICGGAIWYLQMQPKPAPIAVATEQGAPTPDISTGPKVPVTAKPRVPENSNPVAAKPTAPAQPMAEWENKIDQVLKSNVPETETAQLLINMLPTLPPEGQEEAAQHISNLILDKDYNRVLPLVRNAALPEAVLDVFVTDLMNRDDAVKLPTLLDIAKLPNHPHHEEALTDLQIFLDADHGNDWAKWDGSLKEYLKREAQENADAAAVPDPRMNGK